MRSRIFVVILLAQTAIMTLSCSRTLIGPTSTAPLESIPLPTPASTLPELVNNMASGNMDVRLVSIYKLEDYGNEARIAMPALMNNLYVDNSEVRIAAIIALGHLGSSAKAATTDLVRVLHNDAYIHARAAAADTLGLIGDRSALPDLADELFNQDPYQSYDVAISSAVSIARLTGERFTDFDSATGYAMDKDGVPLVVLDARKWWLETGRHQDWGEN